EVVEARWGQGGPDPKRRARSIYRFRGGIAAASMPQAGAQRAEGERRRAGWASQGLPAKGSARQQFPDRGARSVALAQPRGVTHSLGGEDREHFAHADVEPVV